MKLRGKARLLHKLSEEASILVLEAPQRTALNSDILALFASLNLMHPFLSD